jgi:hypothetical protein
MKVKDLVKLLQQENQELEIVFWNELMDDIIEIYQEELHYVGGEK